MPRDQVAEWPARCCGWGGGRPERRGGAGRGDHPRCSGRMRPRRRHDAPGVLWRAGTCRRNVQMSLVDRASRIVVCIWSCGRRAGDRAAGLADGQRAGRGAAVRPSQFVTYYVLLSAISMLTRTWLRRLRGRADPAGRAVAWPAARAVIATASATTSAKRSSSCRCCCRWWRRWRCSSGRPAAARPSRALAAVRAGAAAWRRRWLLLDFVIGSLAFWIEDCGADPGQESGGAFLAGRFVPLALFPPAVSRAARGAAVSLHALVSAGGADRAAWRRLRCRAGSPGRSRYCVGLWACYRLIWRFGLRGYTASGG